MSWLLPTGALRLIGEIFLRVWDYLQSPVRRKRKAREEADKVIATHDEEGANRMLDRNL